MNEFKSGDVVVHPKHGRGLVQQVSEGGPLWLEFERGEGVLSRVSDLAPDLRRLAVIDPEDREQVERFAETHHLAVGFARWNNLHPNTQRDRTDAMQAALREFVEPEPEEPTGIGAVVEDAAGERWVRATNDTDDAWCWRRIGGGTSPSKWAMWGSIDAVRLLSEGVQP